MNLCEEGLNMPYASRFALFVTLRKGGGVRDNYAAAGADTQAHIDKHCYLLGIVTFCV